MNRSHVLLLLMAVVGLCPDLPANTVDAAVFEAKVTSEPIAPDGTQIQCDLPKILHIKNVGGSDGAGLCVFSSINMAAYYQNVPELFEFQKWMRSYPGGGYPEKVDAKIAEICKQKGAKVPPYIQIESGNIDDLRLALKTGRMVSVTYSFSPSGRYGGSRIAHMVNLMHLDDKWACILDNNFPGTYEWCSIEEFRRAYTGGGKTGWSVVLLNPGPPPVPSN